MDVTVTGKHIDITDPIRDYAREKSARLSKFYRRLSTIEVLADKHDSHSYKVELIAHVDGHEHFIASSVDADLYACIDETVDKMERQLHDYKEKQRSHKR